MCIYLLESLKIDSEQQAKAESAGNFCQVEVDPLINLLKVVILCVSSGVFWGGVRGDITTYIFPAPFHIACTLLLSISFF